MTNKTRKSNRPAGPKSSSLPAPKPKKATAKGLASSRAGTKPKPARKGGAARAAAAAADAPGKPRRASKPGQKSGQKSGETAAGPVRGRKTSARGAARPGAIGAAGGRAAAKRAPAKRASRGPSVAPAVPERDETPLHRPPVFRHADEDDDFGFIEIDMSQEPWEDEEEASDGDAEDNAEGQIAVVEEDEEDDADAEVELRGIKAEVEAAAPVALPAPAAREEHLPMVAIVGRPNVGKSTLFNRLVGRRDALVHDKPGMTRDRRIQRVQWGPQAFLCVDTGGFDVLIDDPLIQDVAEQAVTAVEEADVIIMLTSRVEFDHPAERKMLEVLRRSKKPALLVVNKCDNHMQELEAAEFYAYGFEDVLPISALHGRNVSELVENVAAKLDDIGEIKREHVTGGIAVAVVGRQNVGKSTLINRLLGEDRVIASSLPGTTRDSIDTTIQMPDGSVFTLIDTAGIRRRGKVEVGVEKISVLSSMISLRRCHVAILVIDGSIGITAQDAHIAGYCVEQGRALILAVNKWDIVEKDHKTADKFTKSLRREWGFLRYAPILYLSALTGQRAHKLFDMAKQVYATADLRIPTSEVNERFMEWLAAKPPAIKMNRRPKVKYVAQTGTHPPTFTLFVNEPDLFHFSYERYLMNRLRENYNFAGTPIRFHWRKSGVKKRENPHGDRD